jgi:hypothetical protein
MRRSSIDTGAERCEGRADAPRERERRHALPAELLRRRDDSTLATATSLELPVLKAVESRQEKFEAAVGSSAIA